MGNKDEYFCYWKNNSSEGYFFVDVPINKSPTEVILAKREKIQDEADKRDKALRDTSHVIIKSITKLT